MIFDTNILIYLSKGILRIEDLIPSGSNASISIISYIEALGFPFESSTAEHYMQQICVSCITVGLTDQIALKTIEIRKLKRIKLPDAIIYATALVENMPLVTNNMADFQSLGNKVELINPIRA